MIKVDLITGFLGSGKTTFLKYYARFLMESGYNIGIIENDYGAVNVDMMLLKELEGDNCELEMVAGGCDDDCHMRRFKTKLIAMGMQGFDRVIVEPSGIYDTNEFFDVLHDEPLDRWYEIGSVITIVDAGLADNMTKQSEYLCATQLSNAGCVVFSHIGDVSDDKLDETKAYLNRIMSDFGCNRALDREFVAKDWNELEKADYEAIRDSGYQVHWVEKLWADKCDEYKSLYFMNLDKMLDEILDIIKAVFNDMECGSVFRIKGFGAGKGDAKEWFEINAAKDNVSVSHIADGQNVIIVIGENLNEERISQYFE